MSPGRYIVGSGELRVARAPCLLNAPAIGSCVVVAACDPEGRMAGMAHIMLPGRMPSDRHAGRYRYAHTALAELLRRFARQGVPAARLRVCLAGGANVLQRPDDAICQQNIDSVTRECEALNLDVIAASLGGVSRRSLQCHAPPGLVTCRVGDGPEQVLLHAKTSRMLECT